MTRPRSIVGIDPGATESIVAHVGRSARVTCRPDRHGEVLVASCVWITDNGTVAVGHGARAAALRAPNRFVAAFNDPD
ncbi:MAG: hypothetical protein IID36_12900 [Planctomycetes bacterium]|nr:hypothetical protein [Planctomycetota bacterium]